MTILIAEDDAVLRRLLQSYLEKAGHRIVAAQDGAQAWQRFQAGEFPVVITDWMMPEMDGLELVRRIRSCERPGYVYILLLTSRSDQEDIMEGLAAGADDFVTKPFDQDELKVRLRIGERFVDLQRSLMERGPALPPCPASTDAIDGFYQPLADLSHGLDELLEDALACLSLLESYREGRDALARVDPERARAIARLEDEIGFAGLRESLARRAAWCAEQSAALRDRVLLQSDSSQPQENRSG